MEIPKSQVRAFLEDAGAELVGSDAVDAMGEVIEEVGEDVATEAASGAESDGRVTVTAEDVRTAAGRLAVHDIDSPLPPTVVPQDVVERHFQLIHDDLDEVIKKHWRGE